MDGNLSTFLSEDLSREALLYHVTIPLRIRPNLSIHFCLSSIYHMKVKVKVAQFCLTLCAPWTTQSMEFSRPEYWSGSIFPSPGNLSNPGIKPSSPALQADSLPSEPPGKVSNSSRRCISRKELNRPPQIDTNIPMFHSSIIHNSHKGGNNSSAHQQINS